MASARIAGNAARVSLVVGTVLNLINQGEYLIAGEGIMPGHMLLNYLVPYGVASYSGARAVPIRDAGDEAAQPGGQPTPEE
ncbi:MAG: nitrate/nitrite transporter NrtS [Pseudomonadota bacterium]|nr:nitrate/nitrite transporter NrtS [Pseudomonadota bacterium]